MPGAQKTGRRSVLTDAMRARVFELSDLGWSTREIGRELGVGHMTVQRALEGHTPALPLLRGVPDVPGLSTQPAKTEAQE